MAEIQLKHVYKRFEENVVAVDDFNLEIKDKEFVVFVGPSGCGKSTTLRMIAGVEEISDGKLIIDGKEMNRVASSDRDIAMVFQNYALYPHMTVFENMAYSLRLKKVPMKERRRQVEEVAKILGLEEVLDRKPGQLSGGQKQRVAMGRAIVRKPKAFLMDEPLSNLDAKLRVQMRNEIMKLYHELDATFIYVTHDQVEAMTMGTKIVVMKAGVVQQIAPPEVLYNQPENVFVAGFIGMPPMNFFEGICRRGGENGVYIEMDHLKIDVSKEMAERLKRRHMGETIILGVRPEDMILEENEETHEVSVFEMLGAESYVHFEHRGKDVSIRLTDHTIYEKGRKIGFSIQKDKIHIFDKETEKRIKP